MSREHVHRGSITSLVSSVFEAATSKIFPLEPDIDIESTRSSERNIVGGASIQEPLIGRGVPSRKLEGKTKVHQKR